jgi:hypothetical protein
LEPDHRVENLLHAVEIGNPVTGHIDQLALPLRFPDGGEEVALGGILLTQGSFGESPLIEGLADPVVIMRLAKDRDGLAELGDRLLRRFCGRELALGEEEVGLNGAADLRFRKLTQIAPSLRNILPGLGRSTQRREDRRSLASRAYDRVRSVRELSVLDGRLLKPKRDLRFAFSLSQSGCVLIVQEEELGSIGDGGFREGRVQPLPSLVGSAESIHRGGQKTSQSRCIGKLFHLAKGRFGGLIRSDGSGRISFNRVDESQ